MGPYCVLMPFGINTQLVCGYGMSCSCHITDSGLQTFIMLDICLTVFVFDHVCKQPVTYRPCHPDVLLDKNPFLVPAMTCLFLLQDIHKGDGLKNPINRVYSTNAAEPWHVDDADVVGES